MSNPTNDPRATDSNPDPLTGAPGAHPIGVGAGAAGGAATGAAIGTAVAGPVGTVVGGAIGAVAGGLAGKGVAEAVNPTAEDTYWRENHANQPFAKDRPYDDYAPAYRTGYTGYAPGTRFEDAEPKLRQDYESVASAAGRTADKAGDATSHAAHKVAHGTQVAWDDAKHAARAAWHKLEHGNARPE
jgi:hypothetical protein